VDGVPRHPSQLYEFALEGVVLFTVCGGSRRARGRAARLSGAFLLGYGILPFWCGIHAASRTTISGCSRWDSRWGSGCHLPMVFAGAAMIVLGFTSPNGVKREALVVDSAAVANDGCCYGQRLTSPALRLNNSASCDRVRTRSAFLPQRDDRAAGRKLLSEISAHRRVPEFLCTRSFSVVRREIGELLLRDAYMPVIASGSPSLGPPAW